MTLTEAAQQWVEAKQAIKAAEALLKPAKEQLLEHFRKEGAKPSFKRVGYSRSTYLALDTDAVRTELADRLDEFEVVRERETLSVLGS